MGERVLASIAALLAVTSFACAQAGGGGTYYPPPTGTGPALPPTPYQGPGALNPQPPPAGLNYPYPMPVGVGAQGTPLPPTPYQGPGPNAPPPRPPAAPAAEQPAAGEDGPHDGCPPPLDDSAVPCPPNAKKPEGDGHPLDWKPFYNVYGPCCWIDAGYLHWWIKPIPVPAPLLSTGPNTSPPSAGFGILGNPGTVILNGEGDIQPSEFSGARITVGGWLDGGYRPPDCRPVGVEATYFVLGREATHFTESSDSSGSPVLVRPVVDARTGTETALIVSAPGLETGSINIGTTSELWGAEANAFTPLIGTRHFEFGVLAGLRYINFEEGLTIDQNTDLLPAGMAFFNGLPVRFPASLALHDDFETRNNFYSGQLGAQASAHFWRFTVTASGKVALGTMEQQVQINGTTTLNSLGSTTTANGGLLALASNSGAFRQYQFAVAPEGALNIDIQLTDKIHLNAGYTFLYINNVVRPGNQIDRSIDPAQLPTSQAFGSPLTSPSPAFHFAHTEFWAHGLTTGLSLSF